MTPEGVGWVGGRAGIIQAIRDSQSEQTNKRKKTGKQDKTGPPPKKKPNKKYYKNATEEGGWGI